MQKIGKHIAILVVYVTFVLAMVLLARSEGIRPFARRRPVVKKDPENPPEPFWDPAGGPPHADYQRLMREREVREGYPAHDDPTEIWAERQVEDEDFWA